MPKKSKDFPYGLSVDVSEDMRIQLIAVGYFMGNGGEYATPVRNFLSRGLRDFVAKLEPHERKEFDEILANVRIRETKKLPFENQKSPV